MRWHLSTQLLISMFLFAGCIQIGQFERPLKDDRTSWCLTQVAGDELDDFEVYSTHECLSREAFEIDRRVDTYVRLIRPKGSNRFKVQIWSVMVAPSADPLTEVRFLVGTKRISLKPELFHRFSDRVHAYSVQVPWDVFRNLEGDVRLRYFGKFTRDALLDQRRIVPIKALVEGRGWQEQSDIPNPNTPAPEIPRDAMILA